MTTTPTEETRPKKSKYAAKLERRRALYGAGPITNQTGHRLPWPRPWAERCRQYREEQRHEQ